MTEKLYIIFIIFGQISAVAGPLPYDEEECLNRAIIWETKIREKYNTTNRPTLNGRIVTFGDIKFECVWRTEHPLLGQDFTK